MKKIILLICTLSIFAGCYDDTDIWQNITSLDQRVTELEKLCREMNTNIGALSALVRAVEERDYITNVSPINNNGEEIGYTISFAKGSSITIYHGQNGADGKDGQDGVDGKTPVIGVRKDADGIYYWTLNGDWLLDDAGNKIKAIATDGVDGSDGQNGVTPQLKIVDGKWYVSYDNGENRIEAGPATGPQGPQGETGATGPQGPAGSNGQDGDSFFQGIDISNADYVVFTLADGTQIQIPTWSAFEALKSQCEQMNKNIEALSAIVNALQNNDFVTSVTPIYEGGKEVGYIINFSKSGSVTIYHGKDGVDGSNGQDGADGKDGQTPVIGVAKDTDGVYYWTVNGQWLVDENGQKVKAEGRDGADGSNGSNGTDGAPGQDGTDGKDGHDGITPKLKIENGLWFVSYDNGATWLEVGKAVGEQGPQGEAGATGPQGPQGPAGSNGQDGHDGDSFFQGVDYQSSTDYVTFTLADGTQIKVPTWSAFEALKKQCEQMNANIEALSVIVNALQNNDYVTSVTPIYEGGKEIGYIINFSKSGSVTIYHGKDGQDGANGAPGQDGADGKDGQTPVIGVAKDTDGIYYWTVNGQWLVDENGQKVKAEGLDGADGSNGSNGTDGAPGQGGADGKDGQDGITPKLKIENGLWYVSYDNGATWLEVGKATGEQGPQGETGATGPQGPQGQPGVGGDSMFSDIDYSASTDYIVFVLSNGTQIKVPTWSAFEALKKQCEQMNANIEALSVIVNALQNNDYVTSVTPIYEGGKEVGYIINFSKSGSVTIYHGKDGVDGSNGQDGANGADGKDGQTPVIGVAKDTDGIYYWTVDGAWLLDSDGQKVKAVGVDGQNGSNGSNGANGQDGVTPKLKIENGLWYVSYDNGATWLEVGKATGDQGPQGETGATGPQGPQGPAGSNGQDGDSFFQGVDYQSSADYVTFTLADGTQIKVPTWSAFEALKKQCEQMNANIEALSVIVNALQNNDYIKSITPIYEGVKEIGYIIEFTKSGKVTIYHGKDGAPGANGSDGADGANGIDGHTPIIGVAKDTDGIYYWTVDGAWLLDSDGQKVKAVGIDGQNGSNGQNGATGAPGADGQDGVTPQLKIENGKWYVSYNNGQSWLEIGQATGDRGPQGETGATGPQGPQGPAGSNGQDGDSFFQGVDYQSSADYVTFTLADGTQIKVPTWSAFEALKKQCEQMNANIEALSVIVNALQNNDYIKSITPIYEGVKEIGYIIEFTKSGKVTIYHGKDGAPGANGSDGADGANGIDGHTPIIGVAKDTDGIYYWTVDGAWLLGSDGQKVKAVGVDGQNGSNGSNGANGQDGITPQLKIENGLWYVSYDNGATWLEVGKATGDQGPQGDTGAAGPQGPQGTPGVDGDAFFQSVTETNDYVLMVLANGTEIKIPKYSAVAATLTFDNVTRFTATFNGQVVRHSLDLKVSVYYSTTDKLTVYKYEGKTSVTEFNGDTFTIRLTDLAANTTYYYFTEVISDGTTTFSEISSFKTGKQDSYVDWEEGENVGGEI